MRRAVIFLLAVTLFLPTTAFASHFSGIIRGRILLDVEQHGEAWYVHPVTMRRYFMGRPTDAFAIMRELGLGITNEGLAMIPIAGSGEVGDISLQEQLSGRILLQVEKNGEAWYVFPQSLERYYLGRPADAFQIMSDLGLGITSANLAHVPIADQALPVSSDVQSSYLSFTLTNERGSFPVRVITLKKDQFEMITDAAESSDCESDCAAQSLASYVAEHDAFAAIHGTYFCPPDYPLCEEKINTFLPPVYNSSTGVMINGDRLRFHNRPMIVSTADGQLVYYHRATSFDEDDISAGIGNWPSLVEYGLSVVENEPSELSFATKATRGGIGWSDDFIYLVIAQNASMTDFASVFQSLGADFAMNLDGGGSATLYYDGAYTFGPGRALPNAILFRER